MNVKPRWQVSEPLVLGQTLPLPQRLSALATMLGSKDRPTRADAAVDFSVALLRRLEHLAVRHGTDLPLPELAERMLLLLIADAVSQNLKTSWEETFFLASGVVTLTRVLKSAPTDDADADDIGEAAAIRDVAAYTRVLKIHEEMQFYEEKLLRKIGQFVVDWMHKDGERPLEHMAALMPKFVRAVARC